MKLSQRVQSLAESATLAVAAKAARMKADGADVISLGAGEPDFPTPPHIVEAAKRALDEGHTKYPKPASGLPILKNAIVGKLRRENDLDYSTDEIVVTVGGKQAVNLVFQALLDPGDEVIVPVPYWVSYPEIIKLAGGVPVFVQGEEQNGFRLTPEQVRAAVTDATRAIIINSPSNPAGHVYSPDQIRALADVVRGTDITVVSDEIYDRLLFGDRRALSFAAVDADARERTVTLNSASKTYSMTGWRLGFAAGPTELIRSIAKLQSQGTSGAPTFAQFAYAEALSGDQSCVDRMREAFAERCRFMFSALNEIPGVRCAEPGGAFYTFPNVRDTYQRLGVDSSLAFADKLLRDVGVAVVPGVAFGMDGNVRVSFATDMDSLTEAISRISCFCRGA